MVKAPAPPRKAETAKRLGRPPSDVVLELHEAEGGGAGLLAEEAEKMGEVGMAASLGGSTAILQDRVHVLPSRLHIEGWCGWSCPATAGGIPQHGRAGSRSTQLGVLAPPRTQRGILPF
jgi:hypothetical protein